MPRNAHRVAGDRAGTSAWGRHLQANVRFSSRGHKSVAKAGGGVFSSLTTVSGHPIAHTVERGPTRRSSGVYVIRQIAQRTRQSLAEHSHPFAPFVFAGFDTHEPSERKFSVAQNPFETGAKVV